MAIIKQKKESIHATVSPYIKRQAEELVATEEFSSMSDLVSIALAEFIGAYNKQRKEKESPSSNNEVTTKNNNSSKTVQILEEDIETIE